jgi:hypothetical protein
MAGLSMRRDGGFYPAKPGMVAPKGHHAACGPLKSSEASGPSYLKRTVTLNPSEDRLPSLYR